MTLWTEEQAKAEVALVNHRLRCEYCKTNYPRMCQTAEKMVEACR